MKICHLKTEYVASLLGCTFSHYILAHSRPTNGSNLHLRIFCGEALFVQHPSVVYLTF